MASEIQVKRLLPQHIGRVVTVSVVVEEVETVTYTGVLQAWIDTDEMDVIDIGEEDSDSEKESSIRTLVISGQVTGEVSLECDITIH